MKVCVRAARVVALLLGINLWSGTAPLAMAQALPSPWQSQDIGSPALAGSATHNGGVFVIDAAGRDIWGSSDQFRFVYQPISGDVDIRARIDDVTHADPWSKAGVMIRSTLTANAAHGFVLASAGSGLAFQRRAQVGGTSRHTAGEYAAPPRWLRLVRQGTRLSAYSSANGTSWTLIGSDTIALGETAYVGIAVTSHNTAARTTAHASNVSVAAVGLPSGQSNRDIGAPAVAGSASFAAGAYTIRAGGTDIWGAADQFHYVYQQMSGDGEVVARVRSLSNTHAWAKAGVMIRETLAADSRHALALVSAANGFAFQRRPEPANWSEHTAGGAGVPPGWIRLVRQGATFTTYRSADGVTWTMMAIDTINMTASTVYVGIAVTGHNTTTATTAIVDNFRVSASAPPSNALPVVNLTAPASGAQYTAPATIAMTASASDPEGRLSSVEFYRGTTLLSRDTSAPYSFSWTAVPAGTYTLTAVARDADGGSATSNGVTVTVGATTATPPRYATFTASADHATGVTSYLLEVFANGANPATATAVASSDLGKPVPAADGTITVDRATFFSNLAPGTYIATVTAIGPGGRSRSAPVTFTR